MEWNLSVAFNKIRPIECYSHQWYIAEQMFVMNRNRKQYIFDLFELFAYMLNWHIKNEKSTINSNSFLIQEVQCFDLFPFSRKKEKTHQQPNLIHLSNKIMLREIIETEYKLFHTDCIWHAYATIKYESSNAMMDLLLFVCKHSSGVRWFSLSLHIRPVKRSHFLSFNGDWYMKAFL